MDEGFHTQVILDSSPGSLFVELELIGVPPDTSGGVLVDFGIWLGEEVCISLGIETTIPEDLSAHFPVSLLSWICGGWCASLSNNLLLSVFDSELDELSNGANPIWFLGQIPWVVE
ncbi:unnamed protein product [Lepeophtheirus salmonis]|uniref:(salmon louse) hypothetical protein n=1 Tax=Lepeophtheirus salmonis TaxID=72036 RepID=A0A7R8DCJ3_LEPSM|nr:unnamed protein product [Lepeophtheirus salmonis]CAF3043067.1 unnamed protein product [Lepeophtheirus salmonis]